MTLEQITEDCSRAAEALRQRAAYYRACAFQDFDPSIRLNVAREDEACAARLAHIAANPHLSPFATYQETA